MGAPAETGPPPSVDGREVTLAVLLALLATLAFAGFAARHVPVGPALAASLLFGLLFAPIAGLGVSTWAARLARWLAPAPALRATPLVFALLALAAAAGALGGRPLLKPLVTLALIAGATLALLGPRSVAARPMAHAGRLALAILVLWIPIELRLVHGLPLPAGAPASLEAGRLFMIALGLVLFIAVAPLPDLGYTFRLRGSDVATALLAFAAFAVVAIPLGLAIGFIRWAPEGFDAVAWLTRALAIYFMTAVPEELLFRGAVQNLIERRWPRRVEPAGTGHGTRWGPLLVAAVIFGAAHLDNPPAPNFRYLLLASIAGIAYGWAWQRTRRITAAALTHAAVDWVWVTAFEG